MKFIIDVSWTQMVLWCLESLHKCFQSFCSLITLGLIDHRYNVLFNGLLGCFAIFSFFSLWFLGRTSLITAWSHLWEMLIKAQTVFVTLHLVYLSDLTCNYRLISKHPIVIIIVLICFNYVNALMTCSIDLSIKLKVFKQVDIWLFRLSESDDSNLKSGVLIKLFHLSDISDQMPVKWWFMFWSIKQPHDPWIDSVE